MDNELFFYIDVVGGCNLMCPSCPRGNSRNISRPNGLMEPALLSRIINKAVNEGKIASVGLFNWTEPLLHPRLSELVQVIRSHGVPCSISTNLSVNKNFDDLLASHPEAIYVSTSGFNQAIYGRTHKGGDIERVKSNMKALALARAKCGDKTHITVMFHRYLGNQQDELLMKDFSRGLGFAFQTDHDRMMPLEKTLAYIGHDPSMAQLMPDDYEILKLLPIPLDEAMEIAAQHKAQPCSFLSSQIVIDVLGEVELCCAVYDSHKYAIGNYLNTPLHHIQELRHSHPMCTKCRSAGGHVYAPASAPEFGVMAATNLVIKE